jgi:hypothetical protein
MDANEHGIAGNPKSETDSKVQISKTIRRTLVLLRRVKSSGEETQFKESHGIHFGYSGSVFLLMALLKLCWC